MVSFTCITVLLVVATLVVVLGEFTYELTDFRQNSSNIRYSRYANEDIVIVGKMDQMVHSA